MAYPTITHPDAQMPRKLHLFGYPIAHSVGPCVHTFVAESVGLPWKCTHFETPDIEKVVEAMKAEDFIAGAVMMPLKLPIMANMDSIDDLARIAKQVVAEMIAGRFADSKEKIIVVENVEQAKTLDAPFYVVGPGVFLDMCFKPRITQLVEIAEPRGWATIDGIEVLGLQLLEQWRLWLGPNVPLPARAARQKVRDLATGSASLNVSSSVGFNQKQTDLVEFETNYCEVL
ncbi:uncharacterized protein EV420DRAFT_1485781 [Desarmillaria tabescens]|uniref:Shikimate dehydrogenase substrate binding N-terminal domain-containing protein n=1 Tax=Armillaria tabescens TaxID=1929756 RepID=A0AA39MP63_ARMTA|nr:uncharacterized protein EV420DRAFT_1485781 [Desarmillaria tabescens]KAK0440929.1 hypothetical protein EV420DRAFT_1485781 [Desarmillaria tabescens]